MLTSMIGKGRGAWGRRVALNIRVDERAPVGITVDGDSMEVAVKTAMSHIGISIDDVAFSTQYIGSGSSQRAVVCVEASIDGKRSCGAGISTDKDAAFIDAIVSAINRARTAQEGE